MLSYRPDARPVRGEALEIEIRGEPRNGKLATVRVSGNLDCNDGELLHRWMSEGLGLGWRSTWEIQRQLAAGELETVLDEYALPDYDILAVYPQQRYVPARVRYFIDYLKEIYAQPDYWSRAP